uniref:Uncharacterized protein n=1 Tax=Aegilops tauschii subsp. strangulata TaxID=200361 RepID=A0A453CAF7_AEGTS
FFICTEEMHLIMVLPWSMQDPDHYSLRNRGLCLVPVEQTLQLTQSNGADLWAPANTTRRT